MDSSQFDLSDWRWLEESLQAHVRNHGSYWGILGIWGPADACLLHKIRGPVWPYYQFGPSAPVDLFLLALGDPPRRDMPRIGGMPFWPKRRPWPSSESGEPLRFVAQFNFSESTDLVGNLPADVLLIFKEREPESERFFLEWQQSSQRDELVSDEDLPRVEEGPRWYGRRWRVDSYPEAESIREYSGNIELPNGESIVNTCFLFELLGMQIGATPYRACSNSAAPSGGRIICSLSDIGPTIGRPYPFLNRPEPLIETGAERYRFALIPQLDPDCFHVLYVTQGDEGFKAAPLRIVGLAPGRGRQQMCSRGSKPRRKTPGLAENVKHAWTSISLVTLSFATPRRLPNFPPTFVMPTQSNTLCGGFA